MGEVTLPCFLISLPKAIFVIARLVGPFSEKNCDRDLENAVRALRPRAAFSTLISQFFAIECFHRHAMKIKIKNHSVDKVKKL